MSPADDLSSGETGRPSDEALVKAAQGWLSNPNIVGVDVGEIITNGRGTGRRGLVVHVIKKRPLEELGAEDFPIPSALNVHGTDDDGQVRELAVPTDVVETGEPRLEVLNQRARPAPGGYQITATGMPGTGTLGVNIAWAGRYRMMTNNHVISNNANLGANVYQPSNSPNNALARVSGFVPVTTYRDINQPFPVFNNQDLAYCDLTPAVGDPQIAQIGVPTGVRAPVVGEKIVVCGKQTAEVKKATIASITYSTRLEWPHPGRYAWFQRLIRLDSHITQAGDSGAAFVALSDAKVVGINMGGGPGGTIGCDLSPY